MGAHAETKLKYGAKPKTLASYLTGLFLSLIFTMMSFGLVCNCAAYRQRS